jgi:hypothetical protein
MIENEEKVFMEQMMEVVEHLEMNERDFMMMH